MVRYRFHIATLILVAIGLLIASTLIPNIAYVSARECGSIVYANMNQSNQSAASSGGMSNNKAKSIADQGGNIQGIWDWFKERVVKPVVAWACERWPDYIPPAWCEWSHS